MNHLDDILIEIEDLRSIMHELILGDLQLRNPQILCVSQKLDKLIVKIYSLKEQGQK